MSTNADSFLRPGAISEPDSPPREIIPPLDFTEPLPGPLPEVAPMIAASLAAFRRALPELMNKRPKQWVAYHGEECIGFARDSFDLYHKCYRRGLTDDQFVVMRVMPEIPPDMELTLPFEV